MAVADVAVAMGSRNRRRLAWSGISLGVVAAAVVAAVFLTRLPTHTAGGDSNRSHSAAYPGAWRIFDGMTKLQVFRIAGKPTVKLGSCWLYRTNFEFRGARVGAIRA